MVEPIGPGSRLGSYTIEKVIGRGGMGVVYLASHQRLGRKVALKVIAPDRSGDADFRERFRRESRLAASIEHPHAVPVYEAGEDEGGTVFIAMRFVEGTDLRRVLAEEQWLEPERAARLIAQVAGALDDAHRHGLVHRDVKPANVLLGEVGGEEWAYLTDFGATKLASGTDLTATGEWLGTLDYASPEQIRGLRVDARSDVYSLGCVLFESLTGRIPFERDNQAAKLYAHLNDTPPAPTTLDPGLPAALDEVVARALAKEPGDRFPSAGDLARAASAALSGEAATQRERSVATGEARIGVGPDPAATRRLRRRERPDRGGGRRWLRLAASVAALALIAVALVVLLSGGSDPTVEATIAVGGKPLGVGVGGGTVWVTDQAAGVVKRIDPATNQLTGAPIEVGRDPAGVRVGEGAVWVANSGSDTVARIDPASGRVLSEIPVGARPGGIQVGDGYVWVTDIGSNDVSRIHPHDPPGTEQVDRIPVGEGPSGIAVGEGGVWVANSGDGSISRIAPNGPRVVQTIKRGVGPRPRGIAAGGGSVWVSDVLDGTVIRIHPQEGVAGQTDVGKGPAQVVVGDLWVWVANEGDGTMSRIDLRSGQLVGDPLGVGERPRGVALGEDSVWVANFKSGTVSRIAP